MDSSPILHAGKRPRAVVMAVRFSPQRRWLGSILCIIACMVESLETNADEALMLAYANGQAAAFETLYDRHKLRL